MEAFDKAVKKLIPVAVDAAKVAKVNGEVCEVHSLTGNGKFFKCSLNAVRENGQDKVLMTPKVGSTVIIGILEGRHKQDAVILQVCDLEKVYLKIGETTLEVDAGGYKLNGEDFGGIVKAPELKKQVDKNTAILKAVQNAFSNWIVVPKDGGQALKSQVASIGSMGRADLADIENETIKHG